MSDYYLSKLARINYKIAIHPESANIRLTSQMDAILVIAPTVIPEQYRKQFQALVNLIGTSYEKAEHLGKGVHPYKLEGIYNNTASKYIKLLLDIEDYLESESL